jgi:maltose O-acetyltransferase
MVIWKIVGSLLLRFRYMFWKAVYAKYRATYAISDSFRFNGSGIQLYGPGRIVLGADSYVGEHSSIQAADAQQVSVGRACMISHNVRIYTSTVNADSDFRLGPGQTIAGPVSIGEGVWIGANVYIGPGITIGDNSVVGANSVVIQSIPSSEIWGGVPARRIRRKSRDGVQ